MDRERHEEILNSLLNPETENSLRTELLQELRIDNNNMLTSFEEMTTNIEKLTKDNGDLIVSNSKLFRQIGVVGDTEKENDIEQKEFSETVTIEELEKGE